MSTRLAGLLLGVLVLAAPALAADSFEVPADARALMPGDVALIAATGSVNTLVAEIVAIAEIFEPEDAPDAAEMLAEMREEQFGPLMDVMDLDRPAFLVTGLPNLMAGQDPAMTFILPLVDGADDPTGLAVPDENFVSIRVHGSYMALSSLPSYAASGDGGILLDHLPAGTVSATLDLARVVTDYRPFIEMGLAGIPVRPAGASADSVPGMTTEEAAALADVIRKVADSASRLDLAMDRRDDMVSWQLGLGVHPGSALDPGPQPEFARALALTAALPREADIVQAIAFDQERMFAAFRDYYVLSMQSSLAAMDPDQAERFTAWVEQYVDAMSLWTAPLAAAVQAEGEQMKAYIVMEPENAEAAAATLDELLAGLGGLEIGYTMERQPDVEIAGTSFRAWQFGFDAALFSQLMAEGADTAARMQAEQMLTLLQKVVPGMYIGTRDGKLFIAADDRTEGLAAMVAASGRGKPHAELAALAARTGPTCQEVVTGDLMSFVRWMTEFMADMTGEEQALAHDMPIPFEGVLTVDGSDFGFTWAMDLPALGRLVEAFAALEE